MTEHLTQSAAAASLAAIAQSDGSLSCPHCGAEVAAQEAFCEACGGRLTPTAARAADELDEMAAPIDITRSIQTEDEDTVVVARPCANCGGIIGADGYCETCGTKAPTERDHYTERPAPWVAACCDRGVRHHRNEDATAVAAEQAPGSRAVPWASRPPSRSSHATPWSRTGLRGSGRRRVERRRPPMQWSTRPQEPIPR